MQCQLDLLHTTVSEGKVMTKSRQVQGDATGTGEVMPSSKETDRGIHRKGHCSLCLNYSSARVVMAS